MRLFFLWTFAILLAAQPPVGVQRKAREAYANLPLSFERDPTQPLPSFFARAGGHAVWLSPKAITLRSEHGSLELRFSNANPAPSMEALDPLPGTSNYLRGRDPKRWITGVPTFARVRYRQLYPGIDLICHGSAGRFEYDFQISPGADPSRIRVSFDWAYTARIDRNGDLILSDGSREWRQPAPRIYQGPNSVSGHLVLPSHREFGFEIGAYDRSQALVIDPAVVQATYIGGSRIDTVTTVAIDAAGNIYLAGWTNSTNFPVTAGAYSAQQIGGPCPIDVQIPGGFGPPVYEQVDAWCWDVFVAKLNPSGTAMIYSTYVGGTGNDSAAGIAVDNQGNAYVAGWTGSTDFPITAGALQPASAGGYLGQDAFLFQLDPAGAKLLYSTYIGGMQDDQATAIAASGSGDLYLAGTTFSADFPVLKALQPQSGGGDCSSFFFITDETVCSDAFLMHWRIPAMTLVYSTFLGGSVNDSASALALDPAGNVYLAGTTSSADFPLVHPLQPAPGGGSCVNLAAQSEPDCSDAFIAKINAAGSAFVYSTFLGGAGNDSASGIAADAQGNAYVAGTTYSANFPVVNAIQNHPGGGVCYGVWGVVEGAISCSDGFAAKINPQGSALLYSTYLGGLGNNSVAAIAADAAGDALVAGSTSAFAGFPITSDALSHCNVHGSFLTELNPAGTLTYSTFFNGNIAAIALPAAGHFYLAGQPGLLALPLAPGAVSTTFGSPSNYVAMLDLTAAPPSGAAIDPGCVVNAAGYDTVNASNILSSYIAPGEIVSIFGQGLGPAAGAAATLDAQGNLPTQIAGVSVTFNGTPAPLLYVSANQVNAIVPFEVTGSGVVPVQLQYQAVSLPPVQMTVTEAVPGIFTSGASGTGQAAALNQDGSLNSPSNPAARGSIVTVWATGLGLMNVAYPDGQVVQGNLSAPVLTPAVYVNDTGAQATLQYAGQAPGMVAGAIQINLVIPTFAQTGPAIQVFIDYFQQGATIAIK